MNLFIQSLNDMIDSFGNRPAQLQKHVSEIVLMLLFVIDLDRPRRGLIQVSQSSMFVLQRQLAE